MNTEDQLFRVARRREAVDEPAREARYESDSNQRLLNILRKKLRTTFIGALSSMEKHFGKLWGHGKTMSECTDNERAFRDIWEVCRNEILNSGNKQLRAVEQEVAEYKISWNKYRTELRPAG